jgi:hypothetical protein
MRRTFILAALTLVAAACAPLRERVVVNWTFAGQSCAAAGVARINIDVDGEVLTPDHFTCAEAGQGVDLGSYLTGPYLVTITGLDAFSIVTHQVQQTIQVRRGGGNTFDIDVPAVPQTTGQVTLHWSFNGRTCAQANVSVVHVSVDNQVVTDAGDSADLPCSARAANGVLVDGVTIEPLSPGQHSFDLVGLVNGRPAFALYDLRVAVTAGGNTVTAPDLKPAAPTSAGANLSWDFGGKSCAAAGVDTVRVYFDPPGGALTEQSRIATVACSTNGADGVAIDDVPEGTHTFGIVGLRGNVAAFYTHNPAATAKQFFIGGITNVFVPAEPQ